MFGGRGGSGLLGRESFVAEDILNSGLRGMGSSVKWGRRNLGLGMVDSGWEDRTEKGTQSGR